MAPSPHALPASCARIGRGELSVLEKRSNPEHADAITRRIIWVEVKKDIRRCASSVRSEEMNLPVARGSGDWEEPFEDVFGFGGDLD